MEETYAFISSIVSFFSSSSTLYVDRSLFVENPDSALATITVKREMAALYTNSLVDVVCGFRGSGLHSSRSWETDGVVDFKGFVNATAEILLIEEDSKGGCVFDGHACSLALMGHHLIVLGCGFQIDGECKTYWVTSISEKSYCVFCQVWVWLTNQY